LYFVATNHINYFDSAIIRSNRFDALMLVSPPSFRAKIERLTVLLNSVHGLSISHFETGESEVQKDLDAVPKDLERALGSAGPSSSAESKETLAARWREERLDKALVLAKFTLLRYDELDELAYHLASLLRSRPATGTISTEVLKSALEKLADPEWRKNKSYDDFFRDTRSERRDYQMLNVWEVIGVPEALPKEVEKRNSGNWLARSVDSPDDIKIKGFEVRGLSNGRVEIRPMGGN
jgi:hypothetical protein